jgi:hypothetical protein
LLFLVVSQHEGFPAFAAAPFDDEQQECSGLQDFFFVVSQHEDLPVLTVAPFDFEQHE